MIISTILTLLGLIILLSLSGWFSALLGKLTRYLYVMTGIIISAIPSIIFYKPVVITVSILFSFWMYWNAEKMIHSGRAASHVPATVTLSMSGYFIGSVLGLIFSFFR